MALNVTELQVLNVLTANAVARLGRPARMLLLAYPDVLIDEATLVRSGIGIAWADIEKREDSQAAWQSHGRTTEDSPMVESKALFRLMGAEPLVLDAIAWGREDVILDLNQPIDAERLQALGGFDIIVDPGTLEHCFNIAQAFLNIVELLNPGGYVYHQAAMAFPNHGFWSISPTAFVDFYDSRGFVLGQPYAWAGGRDAKGYEVRLEAIQAFRPIPDNPRRVGSFLFQKPAEPRQDTGEPLYPVQRCYSSKPRRVPLVDLMGPATGQFPDTQG